LSSQAAGCAGRAFVLADIFRSPETKQCAQRQSGIWDGLALSKEYTATIQKHIHAFTPPCLLIITHRKMYRKKTKHATLLNLLRKVIWDLMQEYMQKQT